MDHFKQKFLEEASDLIEDLEKILLEVEGKGIQQESIEQIFRIMHTIKGSSSMFGFDAIGEFTHNLETIYDLIRNGQLDFSKEILNITLSSIDHIRKLLDGESDLEIHESLSKDIKLVIGNEHSSDSAKMDFGKKQEASTGTYYILFRPEREILLKGNNPLYLLQDLQDLGTSKVLWHMHSIPDIQAINPKECHIYWEIILSCDASAQEIREVFMFVEDNCELIIEKVADGNLFSKASFVACLDEIPPKQELIDLEKLKAYANSHSAGNLEADDCPQSSEVVLPKSIKPKAKQEENSIASIRVSSDKLDDLMNLVSELVTTQARLSLYANNNLSQSELNTIAENIEKISRQLRDNTFSICLIPIETMITRFQRLIRDLSKQLNKEIVFVSEGTETEIDKTIIDSLTDPLMHIFRNCIDHGIEDADTRVNKGKPKHGTISLRAYYSGTNVHIEVKDDGAGIDKVRIREKAISKGLIGADVHLSEKEIFDLMFLPGFSTAAKVTEVSGRGVGMDVVKRQITSIRGTVDIESTVNVGTTITIALPLTLSIIDGLLVMIGHTKYVIPLSVVDKCFEVEHKDLVDRFDNLLEFDGVLLPFIHLRNEFEVTDNAPEIQQVVLINYYGKKMGITVDYVIGEYQAVLKPLGKLYRHQDIMSGATILGDGTIALVMDTNQIIKKTISKIQT